jgi:hypothetical protein
MTRSPLDRRSFLGKTAAAALGLALSRFAGATGNTTKPATGAGLPTAAKLDGKMELAINFSIVKSGLFMYRRPYVAVWLEDAAGGKVRTLSVWAKNDSRGQRYLEHLTRWMSAAGTQASSLLSTVSSPTRDPGSYTLVWDGKTEKGVLADAGTYFLCIESAREHGPYALVREKVTVGGAANTTNIAGNGDIGDVSAAFRKRA